MKLRVSLLFFCLALLFNAKAENKVDSLNEEFIVSTSLSSKVELLIEISEEYIFMNNYRQALLSVEQGLGLVRTVKDIYLQHSLELLKAQIHRYNGDEKSAQLLVSNIEDDFKLYADNEKLYSIKNKLLDFYLEKDIYDAAVRTMEAIIELGQPFCSEEEKAELLNRIGVMKSNNLGLARLAVDDYEIALKHYQKTDNLLMQSTVLNNLGNAYIDLADYNSAVESYKKSLKINELINNQSGIAKAYNNIGETYRYRGNYGQALEYYLQSLKIGELLEDTLGISVYINNIGIIYYEQRKYNDAIRFFQQAVSFGTMVNFNRGLAESYNYLGLTRKRLGEFDEALVNFNKSLKISQDYGDKVGQAASLVSIGMLNLEKRFYDSALLNFRDALKVASGADIINSQIGAYLGMAKVQIEVRNYEASISSTQKALNLAQKIDAKPEQIEAYELLGLLYERLRSYELSLNYFKKFNALKDTLHTFRTSQRLDAMETEFLEESKEREIQLLRKERELQRIENQKNQAQLEKQETQQKAVIVGLMLLVLLAGVMVIAYNERRKAFEKLALQKNEIELKNRDITSSIEYAKIIQEAILTSRLYLDEILKNHFVFYRAKDIVSGDFYWAYKSQRTGQIIIAVVDCTGHGVPGAFMSMIGISLLNEIVIKARIRNPAEVLTAMRKGVIEALLQGEKERKKGHDGMDVSFIVIDKKAGNIQFAGANNGLYRINNNNIEEWKGDKQPVGFFGEYQKAFSNHIINIHKGDKFYLSTDGYPDQFGGPNNKKFKHVNFKKLLLEISSQNFESQAKEIESRFENWRGEYEQLDDICVLGFEV